MHNVAQPSRPPDAIGDPAIVRDLAVAVYCGAVLGRKQAHCAPRIIAAMVPPQNEPVPGHFVRRSYASRTARTTTRLPLTSVTVTGVPRSMASPSEMTSTS